MVGKGLIGAAVIAYVAVLGCVTWPGVAPAAKSSSAVVSDVTGSSAGKFEGLPMRGAGMQIQRTDWIHKYKTSMDELAAAGCDTVELVIDTRMETAQSTRIYLDM